MITLTRLNGEKITINLDLIEMVEETPDSVITLTTGKKLVVREKTEDIMAEIVRFKKLISTNLKK